MATALVSFLTCIIEHVLLYGHIATCISMHIRVPKIEFYIYLPEERKCDPVPRMNLLYKSNLLRNVKEVKCNVCGSYLISTYIVLRKLFGLDGVVGI